MTRLYIVDQSGLQVGGHYYSYTGCVADGARQLGLDVIVLANKKFRVEPGSAAYDIEPCFTYTWAEAERDGALDWRAGNIAYEIYRALRRYPPAPNDHVFLHTIGYRELLALLNWFVMGLLPGDPLPYFHLLLRRDPDILIDNYRDYARQFSLIKGSPYLRRKLRFHADTDLLAKAFAELTGVEFSTAPIPFPQEHLVKALATRVARQPGDPLTAVYLGDARQEKGYQHLPPALSYLWPGYVSKGRLRFILQSNFNTPGGEPGILSAAQNLAGHPATTLLNDALQPAEYYETLAQADLVLIPYSSECYRARSSGILVEAIAAGKPVVTTTGSWMATQVTPQSAILFDNPGELGRAIAEAVDRFDELTQGMRLHSRAVLDSATGDHLVRHLLATCSGQGEERLAASARRRVLLVMNGDAMVLRNGASRIAEAQLRYLADAGYAVVGLFLTYRGEQNIADAAKWRAALAAVLSPFDFERVFTAGPGELAVAPYALQTLRDERQPPTWPLRAEFDFIAAYEFGGPLLHYLRVCPPDVVLLNYVTNYPVLDALGLRDVPVVCEMHDVQSLQRAIYGNRAVDPADLEEECRWLARCAALVSLSRRETAVIRERLPEAQIETTGVILPTPLPSLHFLAGAVDLDEIIGLAAPADSEKRAEIFKRLNEVGFIDLLFVGSNHLPNVSGLRWFLSEIYQPHLAGHRVSLVVAGTVCEIDDWPDLPRVFFIGAVDDLAPLYAAARIVVLPILDGAGSAVKSFEALSYGRPVVATRHAFRGAEDQVIDLAVHDRPSEFAGAVLQLLHSEPARRLAAAASHKVAASQNDRARYYRKMDGLFADVLGGCAVTTPPLQPDCWMPAEWSPTLQAVNRLARDYIERLPLEGWALQLLAASGSEVDGLIDAVNRSLGRDGDAAILRGLSRLPQRNAPNTSDSATGGLAKTIRLALACCQSSAASNVGVPQTDIVTYAALPLTVACGQAGPLEIDGQRLRWRHLATGERLERTVLFQAQVRPRDEITGLRVLALRNGELPQTATYPIVLRHALPIEPAASLFGRNAFTDDFVLYGDGAAELRPGGAGILRLPRLADGSSEGFIDLVFMGHADQADGSFDITINGESVEPELQQLGEGTLARILFSPHSLLGDFGEMRVEVTNWHPAKVLRLVACHSGLLLGPGDESRRIAAALLLSEQRAAVTAAPRLAELVHGALFPVIRGEPLRPTMLSLLASVAARDAVLLSPMVEQILRRQPRRSAGHSLSEEVSAILDGIDAMVAAYHGKTDPASIVISPALPLMIVDVEDHERQLLSAQAQNTWASPTRPSWRAALPRDKGERLRLRLGPVLNPPGHPGIIGSNGFHPLESGDTQFRWTGPERDTSIILPLALTCPARLAIDLARTGENVHTDDFTVLCNGQVAPHAIEISDAGTILAADLPAASAAAPWTEITLSIRHLFKPPAPDLRLLGVVFRSLSITFAEPSTTASEIIPPRRPLAPPALPRSRTKRIPASR